MTLRVLQIPLSEASYPGMSSDGNWISFPAGDRNGRWDIYYMHTASSEPKRVTHDSAAFSQQVSDISPDGSQIAYTQVEPATGERSLYVIASLGGVGRRIALQAGNVRWRPDAQRLGFERIVQAGNQLWSVRPDGTDERLEFTDSSAAGRYSFAYSPDGGSVAWIRSFPDYYQEVFTHDLATGAERQLTFDKKNVDDVCWLRNGMILYSSNKSGNTNLWVVPATGGASQQVTKGSGPDIGITASWDGKKVLYLQQQPIATVWITDTKGGEPQQLTFDDRNITAIDISPDRSQIVFIMADPDPIKKAAQIVVQDRATGNRVVVASDAITTSAAVWSPDGKWIAYGTFSPGQPQDSVRIQLVDPRHPGPPRLLHNGFPIGWVSDTTLVIGRPGVGHVELLSIVSGAVQGLGVDSTFVFPVAKGSRYLMFDNRPPAGAYLADGPAPGAARTLIAEFPVFSVNNDSVFLFRTKAKEWFAYDFRTRKRARIASISMGNSPNFNASLSRDAAEIVYTVSKQSGKLVMIENMFQ
jgi:Tol biopolymer transport system component